jgi:hypothetical protein
MQPSSSAFAAAITQFPQKVVAKAEVWSPTPNARLLAELSIDSSSSPAVTDDETQQVRRTATLTAIDTTGTLTAGDANDMLHPLSLNRIKLFRGLMLPGGPEYIPVGTFENTTPVSTNMSDGKLQIQFTLNDQMSTLSRFGWPEPFFVIGDMTQIIYNTVNYFLPGLEYNMDVVPFSAQATPGLIWGGLGSFAQGSDPATNISGLATDVGMELFFDAAGKFTFRSLVDPRNKKPQFTFIAGPGCTASTVPKTLDVTQWYNCVCVEAGGGGLPFPIRSVVYIPPLPRQLIPFTYTSPNITSQEMCNAAALGLLWRMHFALELVTMTASADPRLNAGDTAYLYFPKSKINGVYHAQSVQMPLDAGTQMQVVWRPIQMTGLALSGIPVSSSGA